MAYTKRLDPEKYRELQPHLEKILALEKGRSLTISGFSQSDAVYIRWLIYNWLHHMNVKTHFRIRTETGQGSTRVIRIQRIGMAATPISITETTDPELVKIDELVRIMILADDPEAVLRNANVDENTAALARERLELIME